MKMKITTICVPCLLERIRYQSELKDTKNGPDIIKACLEILAEGYDPDVCSAELATIVHKKSHDMLGFDPYYEMKEESNRVAVSLLPRARDFIRNSSDPLESAMVVSVTGNVMDFGISERWKTPSALSDNFDLLLSEGLGHNDLDRIKPYLKNGNKIIYFTDNCGEVVLDQLLLEHLKERGCRVVLVVKGEPILTDATIKDVEEFQLGKIVDRVLTTGVFAVGLDMNNIPADLLNEINSADLIISKGMANFEAFSEKILVATAFLLRTKCLPVASALGLPVEINAAKLVLPGWMPEES
ncbi:MAG: ARMT1-like domain-containing protein [Candidatus Thermoplasmatota archaeon]|nr:ARMT1-like domain-containing protein [Candidatus Thermoplasmatota archaeon]